MTSPRLSALDASFLAVETPTAHMHVGWVATFSADADGRLPSFAEVRDHIELRLGHAARYRQKLASVPLGVHAPEWIDDPAFSVDRHVYWAPAPLEDLIDEVMSIPLRRDRPLWEMWICSEPAHGRFAIVGKTHHCMVDGLAALELASLLLDLTPEPAACEPGRWRAEPEPGSERVLARGLRDLLGQQLDLLQWPLRLANSPAPAVKQTVAGVVRATRALDQLLRAAPTSVLNEPLSPLRVLARLERPLEDLRRIKRAYGTTINDVILAAVAGGLREYLIRRGEEPATLKVMVPVSVRSPDDEMGNHISFVFAELPCEEPDPLGRLYQVHASMSRCKRDGEPEGSDLVLKLASRTPATVQQALSRLFASPRAFNLVVSNIPGPNVPMYLLGCRLQTVHPMVPLSDNHAVSVGMLTVDEKACFGVYADRQAMPDAGALAQDLDGALGELLALTDRVMGSPGSLLQRARAALPEDAGQPQPQPQPQSAPAPAFAPAPPFAPASQPQFEPPSRPAPQPSAEPAPAPAAPPVRLPIVVPRDRERPAQASTGEEAVRAGAGESTARAGDGERGARAPDGEPAAQALGDERAAQESPGEPDAQMPGGEARAALEVERELQRLAGEGGRPA